MKKTYFALSLGLLGAFYCQAEQNNDTTKSAKEMIADLQSPSDRLLELKLKKQNLVLQSFSIPGSEADRTPQINSGKKN